MNDSILELKSVHSYIGQHHILQGMEFQVARGRATVLLGRNGAGKSTTLRTIMGLTPASRGEIKLENKNIEAAKPYEIARMGVGFVPEDRSVLSSLSVGENIRLAMIEESQESWKRMDTIFKLFPDLKKFWRSRAGSLSGGQKQMLAIARAFVCDHKVLLIDEPSKGLAPIVVDHLAESLNHIRDVTTVILVEQNFRLASMVGLDYFILDEGHVVLGGAMAELEENHEVKQKYLAIA